MLEAWTILKVLDWTRSHFEAKGVDAPRLDAELILAKVLKQQRVMLYAKFDQPLAKEELAEIRGLVARRARGEPMAYILGEKEFYGIELEVTPDVLIPRPDTELLVDLSLKLVAAIDGPDILDVGTGSGAIAIAVVKNKPGARMTAVDISEAALKVAEKNAEKNQAAINFLKSDLLTGLPAVPAFDLIAANLPYIQSAVIPTLDRGVKDFEPTTALDGGDDGLVLIRRLAAQAKTRLKPGGFLAMEIGYDQRVAALEILSGAGYLDVEAHRDLGGNDRVVLGKLAH